MSQPASPSPLAQLLAELDQKVQHDYQNTKETASGDPQQAGHIAEATWKLLGLWLPMGYSVGTRGYIVAGTNQDSFEWILSCFVLPFRRCCEMRVEFHTGRPLRRFP